MEYLICWEDDKEKKEKCVYCDSHLHPLDLSLSFTVKDRSRFNWVFHSLREASYANYMSHNTWEYTAENFRRTMNRIIDKNIFRIYWCEVYEHCCRNRDIKASVSLT